MHFNFDVVGYDDDGNEITQKGIYRIDDIELLDEIIAFGPNVNTDRIIAFGHALLLAKYYDDMGFMPESTTQKMNREKREERSSLAFYCQVSSTHVTT